MYVNTSVPDSARAHQSDACEPDVVRVVQAALAFLVCAEREKGVRIWDAEQRRFDLSVFVGAVSEERGHHRFVSISRPQNVYKDVIHEEK